MERGKKSEVGGVGETRKWVEITIKIHGKCT